MTLAIGMMKNKICYKVIAAKVAGLAHRNSNTPCQDHYQYTLGKNLVAVLSDGAGSAKYGKIGARILCSQLCAILKNADFAHIETEIKNAIAAARQLLIIHRFNQTKDELGLDDFAATLVGMVYFQGKGIFFHIGDGAALSLHPNNEFRISRPENGNFSCETFFFTQSYWRANLRFTRFSNPKTMFLMSDGVTSFAFHPDFQTIEPNFIPPINNFLLSEQNSARATKALSNTLNTPKAQKLNSDDKTIVWIKVA